MPDYPLFQHVYPPIVRLRVTPDEPAEGPPAIVEQRPHGSRRGRQGALFVRAHRSDLQGDRGEDRCRPSIISHWKRDGAWQRPPHAPRATNMVPSWRASRRLKLRKLATQLEALAQRYVRELEQAPSVDVETLMQALQVLKMARLEAMPRWGRGRRWTGPAVTGAWTHARDEAIRTALKEMRRGGVDIDRAPKEAVEMLIEANVPVEDHPALRPRGRRRR